MRHTLRSTVQSKGIFVLMTAVIMAHSANGQTPDAPAPAIPAQVTTIRTFDPHDLQQSSVDRLSGGLQQQTPFRMVADSQGRILVTDPYLSLVDVFDIEAGKRYQINGDRTQRMIFPTYIAVDADDNIYVSEPLRAEVNVFRPDGHYLRSIGGDHLYTPFGLVIDKVTRKLYVAEHHRDEIQVYSLDGRFLQAIGSRGTAPGQLLDPCDIALHHGMLFVLDRGNARLQFFDLDGNSKGVWPFGNNRNLTSFALDSAGNLYAIDMQSLGLEVLDPSGHSVGSFDVVRPYGQPKAASQVPTVTSLAPSPDGSVLALRPALTIDVLKLQPETQPAPPQAPPVQ